MKNLNTTLFTLIAILVLATGAFAQQGQQRRTMADRPNWANSQPGNFGGQMFRIPNLTAEQQEQIRKIQLTAQQEGLELRNQLNEKQAELRTLTTGSSIDRDAANVVIDEIGSLQTQLMKHRLDTRMSVRKLLTEEQRVVFDTRPNMGRQNLRSMRSGRSGPGFHRW